MGLAVSAGRRGGRERRLRADAARQPRVRRAGGSAPRGARIAQALRASPAMPPPRPGWPASRPRAATSAGAIRRYRAAVARLPLPRVRRRARRDRARGRSRTGGARATSRSSAPSSGCSRRSGVNTDVELALFEADHGSAARGVALAPARLGGGAERALGRRARLGADARRAPRARASRWARRALRLGSRDPMFLYHAGMAAPRGGPIRELARRWLKAALSRNPRVLAALRAAEARAGAGGTAMRRLLRPRQRRARWRRARRAPGGAAPIRWATSRSTT